MRPITLRYIRPTVAKQFIGCILTMMLCIPGTSLAAGSAFDEVHAAFDNLEYDKVEMHALRALQQELSTEQEIAVYEILATIYVAYSRTEDAQRPR